MNSQSTSHRFYGWLRGLGIQRGTDRWIGGVSSGIAHRVGIDPVIVRGLFILFIIFGGIGVLAYGVAWALLPEPDGRIHLEGAARGYWSDGMTGALIVSIVGFFRPFGAFWDTSLGFGDALWTLIWVGGLIALGAWLFNRARDRKRKGAAPVTSGPTTDASGAAPGASVPTTGANGPGTGGTTTAASDPGAGGTTTGTDWPSAPTAPMTTAPTAPLSTGTGVDASPTAPTPPYAAYESDSYGPPPLYDEYRYDPDATGRNYQPQRQQKVSSNRGPSAAMVAISAGLAMLAGGGLLALHYFNAVDLGAHAGSIAAAAAAVVLGVSIVIAGLLGRTSGTTGFLAVVALLAAVVLGLAPTSNNFVVGSNTTWDPPSAAVAESGYTTAMAQGHLTLEELAEQAPLDEEIVVPVQVAMGNMTVTVPDGVPVEVRSNLAFSSLNFDGDGTASSGIWNPTDQTLNAGAPGEEIILELRGIFSQVTIAEAGNGSGQ